MSHRRPTGVSTAVRTSPTTHAGVGKVCWHSNHHRPLCGAHHTAARSCFVAVHTVCLHLCRTPHASLLMVTATQSGLWIPATQLLQHNCSLSCCSTQSACTGTAESLSNQINNSSCSAHYSSSSSNSGHPTHALCDISCCTKADTSNLLVLQPASTQCTTSMKGADCALQPPASGGISCPARHTLTSTCSSSSMIITTHGGSRGL